MTLKRTDRVLWVDAAKGLAIFLVVLLHSVQISHEAGQENAVWLYASEMLQTMRMPLFFLVSGLFARKWATKPLREILRYKVFLFAWVFTVWVLIRFAILSLDPAGRSVESRNFGMLLEQFVNPVAGWFVYVLAFFFLILKATSAVPRLVQIAVAAAVSIVWFSSFVDLHNFVWDGMGRYYVFFLVGCYGRELIFAWNRASNVVTRAGVLALWAAAYVSANGLGILDVPGVGAVLGVFGAASGIVVAELLSEARVFTYLGQRTLLIYMSHHLWLQGAGIILGVLAIPINPIVAAVLPLLLTAFALTIALAVGIASRIFRIGWLFDTPRWLRRRWSAVPDRDDVETSRPGRLPMH